MSKGNRTVDKTLNRRFLITAIILLGLLILSSLTAIFLILTEPQNNLAAYQGVTATITPSAREAEARATPAATATEKRLIPYATATPELRPMPRSEGIVDYGAESTDGQRIIRYSGTQEGTHRIVNYNSVAEDNSGTPETEGGAEETRQRGRIIFYGTED